MSLLAQTRLILANDLRLTWRGMAAGKRGTRFRAAIIALILVLSHALSIFLFNQLRAAPPPAIEVIVWSFFAFIMLSAAINHSIAILYERADFDLLLSSPVEPRAVLLARLLSIGASTMLGVALFILPILNGAALGFNTRYFAGYLVWLLLAGLLASLGLWVTLGLVRWLGVRRARVTAQVAAALIGAALFLLWQIPNILPPDERLRAFRQATELLRHPALEIIPSAGRGNPAVLGALLLLALVAVALTTRLMARTFIAGTQDASAVTTRRTRATRHHRWTGGLLAATFRKDLRLTLRDPLLLTQVLPSAFYFLPVFLVLTRAGAGLALLAPLGVVLAAHFTKLLSLVATSGEEGWDLIRMSPAPDLRVRLAKLASGAAPPLALASALWLVVALAGHPWLALVSLVFGAATAAACGWLQVTDIRPAPRKDVFTNHYKRTFGRGFLRGFASNSLTFLAGGGAAALAHGWLLVGAFVLTVAAFAIAAVFTFVQPRPLDLETATA